MGFFKRHAKLAALATPVRLHIGCGDNAYDGWVNVDVRPVPGADHVLDVRTGLPFDHVAAIYAEHFLEHLGLDDGINFLRECRRVLTPEGILRVSTPNLDWVLQTHYRHGQWETERDAHLDCLRMNRAFHGWGHQFLYNRQTLALVLRGAGFAELSFHRYGESSVPEMRGLERHETWQDTPEMPHVLIAEAGGREKPAALPADLLEEYRQAVQTR